MKTNEILKDLIDYLSLYKAEVDKTGADVNMTDFLGFLNTHHVPENIKLSQIRGAIQDEALKEHEDPDADISILIVLLFRYAKGYIKKALKASKIHTADEFSFLVTLMTHESLNKTELILKQVMEKTSGTEIINRLLRMGLLEQHNDFADRRSVRVKITEQGRLELIKVLPDIGAVSQLVVGNLNDAEKGMLAYMLRKLEHFHNDIFVNKKELEIKQLLN